MIIVISDFDLSGSGYLNIVISTCNELAARGHDVKALGMGYNGAEHHWNFSIIPVPSHEAFGIIPVMIHNLRSLVQAGEMEEIEALITILDVPMQERLMQIDRGEIPYIGIFPVESGPLCASWAQVISTFDERLVISKFGLRQMEKAGVPGIHFPVGIDTESWRPSEPGEKKMLRESLGFAEDEFVILTVADNQERKNLSLGAEIVRDLVNEGLNVRWNIVTRKMSPVGWKLDDLFLEYSIMDRVVVYERGMPHDRLWILHITSDLFMLTSKAEGLCAVPDSQVLTNKGRKKLKNIEEGDFVYTHKGRIQKVTKVYKRDYQGDLIVIKPRYGLEGIKLTPNHPALALPRRQKGPKAWGKNRLLFGEEPIWTPANELRKGDFLFVPFPEVQNKSHIFINDYFESGDLIEDKDKVVLKGGNQFGATFPHPTATRHYNKIDVDGDLLFILGLYIAEGCWTEQGPDFSLSTKEVDLQNKLAESMKRKFGIEGRIAVKTRNRWSCRYDDRLIGRLLSRLCGKSSHEKRIPSWALWLPKEKLWKLLEGMFLGDGHFRKAKQTYLAYSTVSEDLANDLQTALIGLGIIPYMNRATRGDFEIKIYSPDLGKVAFLNDYQPQPILKKSARFERVPGGLAVPIRSVDVISYVGSVNNLEIEGDESYLISNVAVHNCMPILEAMATKTPVIATHSTAMPEHLWVDPVWDREKNGIWEPVSKSIFGGQKPTGQRGLPIDVEFYTRDPWGNSYRAFASAKDGVAKVKQIMNMPKEQLEKMLERGREYAVSRNWETAGAVLDNVLKKILTKDKLVLPNQSLVDNINPNTIPSPVPVQVSQQGDADG